MNSRLYRVIFNKTLGQLVVVSEKATAQGKAGAHGGSDGLGQLADAQTNASNSIAGVIHPAYAQWQSLRASILVGLGLAVSVITPIGISQAQADIPTKIIADPSANKNQQPTVLNTASGLTQVNIQTPSAAGVSVNNYSQFDVGQKGAILNNSRSNVNTTTAGWVEGNPWLAKGEARIILNQVNSTNPSQLAGYTEIAGKKAELVIANPAGITCSGCGFINAARTTITTGTPTLSNGSLTGFDVNSGTITVDGTGGDTRQSDYTQLIGQSVKLNANMYAKQLDVITGNNQVSYEADPSQTKVTAKNPTTATNQPTGVALDISSLGGMYAGKIRLIGTDKGMGVTNAGSVNASDTLTLDNQGNLSNSGSLIATKAVTLKSPAQIDNSGTIASSQSDVTANSSILTNSGLISSSHGQANLAPIQSLQNSGTISAGQLMLTSPSISNSGRLEQTGTGSLTLNSPTLINQDNAVIGQSLYPNAPASTAPSTSSPPSTASNGNQVTSSTDSDPNSNPTTGNNTGTSDPTPVLPPVTANGSITAQNLTNQTSNAIITSNGPLLINTNQLTNQNQSSIVAQSLNTDNSKTDNQVTNTNSRIQLPGVNWTLASFNNQGGQLISSQGILLNTGSLDNTGGTIATTDTSPAGDIQIHTGSLTNQQGVIQAGNSQTSPGQTGQTSAGPALTISSDSLNNQGGHLSASGDLTLNSGDSNNRQGSIASQHNAILNTGNLNNTDGQIQAANQLNLTSQDLNNAGTGQIYGGSQLALNAANISNTGLIGSGGHSNIQGTSLTNTGTLAAGLNADGTLNSSAAPANLKVTTTGNLTSHGSHVATGNVSLQGNPTDLSGSSTTAGTIALQSAGDLSTQNASLTATDTLTLSAGGTLNNTEGKLAGNHLALTANRLDNTRGSISQISTDDLSLNLLGGLINQQGKIASNSNNLSLTTSNLNNQGGQISHAGTGQLALTAQSLDNSQQGQVLSLGEQVWQVAGDINNNTGFIQGKRFAITAGNLDNTSGSIAAVAPTDSSQAPTSGSTLAITGNLNNHQGQIGNSNTANSPAGDLKVTAQAVSNGAGKVISNGNQTWQVAQTLDNRGGKIQAKRFGLAANQVNNDAGSILAVNSDPATTTPATANQISGSIDNGTGTIAASNGSLILASPTLNNAGEITSRDDLTVTSQSFNNSKLIYAGGTNRIDNQAGLSNSGRIAAQGNVAIHSGSVNQSNTGELIAGILPDNSLATTPQNLTVTADQLLSNQGTTFATGNSQLTGSRLDLSNSHNQAQNLSLTATTGDINHTGAQSQGDVSLTVTSPGKLTNDNGVLQSPQLNLSSASLSNQFGTINQTGTADFTLTTGDIDNQGGNIGSGGNNFTLTAGNVNNSTGHILHGGNGTANINLASLVNDNGVVASQGALNLNSAGAISKQSGTIQGNRLNLTAASLDNTGQVSTTQGDMALNIGALTNHTQAGVIQSAANLTSQGQSVSNSDNATLYAAGNMAVNAATVTNAATIASDKTLTVTADTIGNSGTLQSTNEGIALNTNQLTNASTGQIIAPVAVTINGKTAGSAATDITNQGLISSQGNLTTHTGSLINDKGILSAHNMDIHSQSLSNQQGLISQAGTDGSLNITNQGLLDNQNTKPSSSDSGPPKTGIVASGNATLSTGNLNNQNGLIAGDNTSVTLTGTDAVNNQAGIIAAHQGLTLNAAALNNQQGQLLGTTTQVTAGSATSGSLDNTAGLIQGTDVAVTTGTLTNTQTLQSGDAASLGVVAANNATLNAQVVNNQGGQLLAGNQLTATVSQQLNNQADSTTNVAGGRIQATTVAIIDPVAANRSLVVNNAGGSVTGSTVTLQAKGLNNTAGTFKGGTVGIDVVDSYTHQAGDTLTADNLTVTTQGTMTNQAKLAASDSLTVNATDIDNQQTGELVSGYASDTSGTHLNASNNLSNHGLINGYNTYLQVGNTLNNLSHGRIYGDQVAIKAATLNNTPDLYTKTQVASCTPGPGCVVEYTPVLPTQMPMIQRGTQKFDDSTVPIYITDPNPSQEWIDANTTYTPTYYQVTSEPAPVIGTRQSLDIGVANLNNNPNPVRQGQFASDFNGQAQIISNGTLSIGGDLDGNHHAIGQASSVINRGATIESAGDMQISTQLLKNENTEFKKQKTVVSTDTQDTIEWVFRLDPQKRFFKQSDLYPSDWDYYVKATNEKLGEDFTEYRYKDTIKKDGVIASDPARIIAGGNLTLLGNTFINDKSIMLAGEGHQVIGKELIQETDATSLVGHTTDYRAGSYVAKEVQPRRWGGHSRNNVSPIMPFSDEKVLETYQLPILNAPITSTVNGLTTEQTATIDKYNSAISDLKNLAETPITVTPSLLGKTSTVSSTPKQDVLQRLNDFAKANNGSLSADQQKQLSDLLAATQAGKPVDQTVLSGLIDSLNSKISQIPTQEVRTLGKNASLPNSSLYNIDPNSQNGYLVQTDPAFTGYKNWLSSSYMMSQLGLDPSNMHKRLGDGYYEQQLIDDQVMTLTGKRYLGDYRNDDAMYQTLMDNGIVAAKSLNLRPGIALTAEQMAQLTSDIVWLVDQTVTLPNGSTQTVLVPKVYVKSHIGDIKGDGSLIAADNIDMQLTGDLSNAGNIVAHNGLRLAANNLTNQNGGLIQGNFAQISTKADLNNIGGTLKAGSAIALNVGGNLNSNSTTYTTQSQIGNSTGTRTGIDHVASIVVGDGLKGKVDSNGNPLTTLAVNVVGNSQFTASQIGNQSGSTSIVSGGDVSFNTLKTGYQTNAIGDSNNYYKVGQTQDVGSVVASAGNTVISGNNVTGKAVTIHSDGSTGILAKNDINFSEGRATSDLDTGNKNTSHGLLGSKTTQNAYSSHSDTAIGNSIDGDKVVMKAGHDITLIDTSAISDHDTSLTAGNNLTLGAAENHTSESSSRSQNKSGVFGSGGVGFTIGSQKDSNQQQTSTLSHSGSTVGATDGNVILTAGNHYQQTDSKVVAQMGADTGTAGLIDPNRGNVVINAQSATIENTNKVTDSSSAQQQKTSGLTVKVSNSLVDQAQGLNSLAKASQNTSSDQMKVMAGVAGYSKARTLANGIDSALSPTMVDKAGNVIEKNPQQALENIGNTRIQATIGSQSSKSSSSSHTEENEASSIDSNTLTYNIGGKGKGSTLNVIGSDVTVKNGITYNVEGDVNFLASEQHNTQNSDNKSNGWGVGVYGSTQGGSGVTVNANTAKGSSNGESTSYTNSHVSSGGVTRYNVGGNVTAQGAVVTADHITGNVAGDVIGTSLQDTANYKSSQRNAGVSADFNMASGVPVPTSMSVNGGKTGVQDNYAAVNEQTGFFNHSSDLVVGGKGKFTGAAFTTDTAADNQTVFKQGTEVSDIQNYSKYSGNAINVGLGAGLNKEQTRLAPPGISGIGYGKTGDNQTSTTYAAVTGMAGKSEVTTATKDTLNKPLANSFDASKVNTELGAQVQISQAFDTERRTYRATMAADEQKTRDAAEKIQDKNSQEYKDLIAKANGQQQRMVWFDGITSAIYGPNSNGVTGYAARAIAPEVSFKIGQYFKGNDYINGKLGTNLPGEGSAPHILAHGVLAAAVSVATGNDPTTGALSAMSSEKGAKYVAQYLYQTDDPNKLTPEQKETVSSITSLAGLAVGGSTGSVTNAVNAAETSKMAVQDNWLSVGEIQQLQKDLIAATDKFYLSDGGNVGDFDPSEVYGKYAKISKENSERTAKLCQTDLILCEQDKLEMIKGYNYSLDKHSYTAFDMATRQSTDSASPEITTPSNNTEQTSSNDNGVINLGNLPSIEVDVKKPNYEDRTDIKFIQYENLNDISKYVDPTLAKDIQNHLGERDYKYTNQPFFSKPWGRMYVAPGLQGVGGAVSGLFGIGLLGTCETGITCVAAGYLIASAGDDISSSRKNWGLEPAKQSITARENILRSLGMSDKGAMWSSVALDLSAGSVGIFSDFARINRINTALNAEMDAARIENNINADLMNVYDNQQQHIIPNETKCFVAGTSVTTKQGFLSIENLNIGKTITLADLAK